MTVMYEWLERQKKEREKKRRKIGETKKGRGLEKMGEEKKKRGGGGAKGTSRRKRSCAKSGKYPDFCW